MVPKISGVNYERRDFDVMGLLFEKENEFILCLWEKFRRGGDLGQKTVKTGIILHLALDKPKKNEYK